MCFATSFTSGAGFEIQAAGCSPLAFGSIPFGWNGIEPKANSQ